VEGCLEGQKPSYTAEHATIAGVAWMQSGNNASARFAQSAVASLPRDVGSLADLKGAPYLGNHCFSGKRLISR